MYEKFLYLLNLKMKQNEIIIILAFKTLLYPVQVKVGELLTLIYC